MNKNVHIFKLFQYDIFDWPDEVIFCNESTPNRVGDKNNDVI